MKLIKSVLSISAFLFVSIAYADDHQSDEGADLNAPFNIQVQMCSLHDGVTQKQYDAFLEDYFAWSKKHDVETTFIRQNSLFTHANAYKPTPYDFVEFLTTDHKSAGRGWDKWLTTKDGQKLGQRWSELAECDVKMANAEMIWADMELSLIHI